MESERTTIPALPGRRRHGNDTPSSVAGAAMTPTAPWCRTVWLFLYAHGKCFDKKHFIN